MKKKRWHVRKKASEGNGLTQLEKAETRKVQFVVTAAPKGDGKAYLSLGRRRHGRWEFLVLKQFVDLHNADILMFEHTI